MNVTNPELVIVRGINDDFFKENFESLCIGFGGNPQAIPVEDAYYVALYLGAPTSSISHIGIVSEIDRYEGGADFYLKAIIKLDNPVKTNHPIRKHEYWKLSDFNLDRSLMEVLRVVTLNIKV